MVHKSFGQKHFGKTFEWETLVRIQDTTNNSLWKEILKLLLKVS